MFNSVPKYISMAYCIMFLWIPGREGTRSKVTVNFLVNALHAFHRFNRRYHVKNQLLKESEFLVDILTDDLMSDEDSKECKRRMSRCD